MADELVLCRVAFIVVIWVLLELAGDSGDYQNGKACKAPVKSPSPTYQQSVFLQARCHSCRPKPVSKHWRHEYSRCTWQTDRQM